MSRNVCSEVSSIRALYKKQVDKLVPEREEFETLSRDDKGIFTPNGGEQYLIDLLTKATVQDKTPRGDTEDGIATCREQVTGMIHIGDLMA